MKISHLLYLFAILDCCMAMGQETNKLNVSEENLNFHLLDVSSGLSHNFVNDIYQDSLGFIWIATYDGLNRYDGKKFLQFKTQINEPHATLANNYIQDIEISQDNLLLATDAGLNSYNLRNNTFRLLNEKKGLYNNASVIQELPDGNIVVASYHEGIKVANKGLDNISSLRDFLNSNMEIPSTEISTIDIQGDSIMWIGSFDMGLWKISLNNGTITHSSNLPNLELPSPVVNRIYIDSQQNIWIGTRNGLLVKTHEGESIYLRSSAEFQKGLSDDDILSFQEDQFGQMWIGTRNGGLNILNISHLTGRNHPTIRWYLPRNDGKSVYNRTVTSIFKDRHENMWLATPTGVIFVKPGGEQINLIKQLNFGTNSISHNRIGSLAKASGNTVWVGTDGGGLDLYDPDKGSIKHFQHNEDDPNSLSNNYLISLYQQSSDSLWVGTYQGGLNLLNPQTGKNKHYLQGSTSNGSDVRVIFESHTNVLWIGTNRGGLFEYNSKKDEFNYIESLGKIDIRDIAEDERGNLWLGTYGSGIIIYNPDEGTIREYNQANFKGMTNVIFSLLILPDGNILAGSRYGGLLKINPELKKIENFTEKNGLSNNTINSMIQQDSVYVWMGSYNGLNRYNTQTNQILNISSLNNIQEGEFNIGAAVMNEEGKLFFGGNNGLNIFDPTNFTPSENQLPLRFIGLRVLNRDINISKNDKNAILKEALPYVDTINLNYNQSTFSIDFVALKYPTAKNLTYSYKLENYNDFWIDNQNSGTANFTGVPPGDYNFIVKTDSGLGEGNTKNLHIRIIPPFWQTIPAYILMALFIILSIWLVMRYYSERIKLKNSLLFEQKQRTLEHDLNEERFRFFTAFSHELKTPLTLILAPVQNLLSKEPSKDSKKDLLFIQRNAKKLFKSIDMLLRFRKAEEGMTKIILEPHDLPSRVRRWVKTYAALAKDKKITLNYIGPIESRIFKIDIEKIEIIVSNLISNALKYCDKGDQIEVNFLSNDMGFEIKVQDSGKGILPNDLPHIFDWYYRANTAENRAGTGVGLALSKSFAELHGGNIIAESKINEGTNFCLKIPIKEMEFPSKEDFAKELDELEEPAEINQILNFDSQLAYVTSSENRKLILIIDDNKEILSFLNSIFKKDYDIIHAINGLEGVKKAQKYVPDIIISDLMMPKKSGFDVCADLKGNFATSHIPIILLTADTAIESMNIGYEEGADDYITKPFNTQLLKTRVQNLLESRESLKKSFKKKIEPTDESNKVSSGLVSKEKTFLKKLDETIWKHIATNSANVNDIAKDVGMSRASLYRKLKALTDQSINEYIRNLKIEQAADLITHENYTVSQACYEVGFNNIKYFRKIFKERFGKNPSDFK
ncbi:hybrid sensor histidine kinase/response regulator transcription factor [Gramella sp. AN32]|uniref:histidine kinase n=1 Tax=Christiangramia antarctica TaxID=2058158 RepID=A0ABW5XBG8_9FLAO|nr:hybrid sensor histidine kinase/response regulator transcription factor [Gramella sp. AN32]MCM4157291.1 hybrid sensor histidine kinase/response regulator [Gramella sp. AN32]